LTQLDRTDCIGMLFDFDQGTSRSLGEMSDGLVEYWL
jgi:hypothetical protein